MASAQRSPTAAIEAVALVPAEPEEVFDFLSDFANHCRLASRFVEVVELESARNGGAADRGVVRLRGPLGLRRTASTKVTAARPPRLMIGTAEIAGGTRARVSWTLARRLGDTRVRLAAEVDCTSRLDRLLLALGGRRWLERRFEETIEALAGALRARSPAQAEPLPVRP
jgi:Polyketide cyclase / dehydrase and lipid transport